MKLGIFNEFTGLERNYINACGEMGIDYEGVNNGKIVMKKPVASAEG